MARPSKLTPGARAKVIQAILAGNYREVAARYAGVSEGTFHRWMARGEKETKGLYREFRESVEQAEAQMEVGVVAGWRQQLPETPAEIKHFLARRFPDRWKERSEHHILTEDAVDAEIRKLEEEMARRDTRTRVEPRPAGAPAPEAPLP